MIFLDALGVFDVTDKHVIADNMNILNAMDTL
jgi:hypothetical protein